MLSGNGPVYWSPTSLPVLTERRDEVVTTMLLCGLIGRNRTTKSGLAGYRRLTTRCGPRRAMSGDHQQGEAAAMSTDRGTMQRGPVPGVDQQGAWAEPTAPAGRRLPSAPRERKPALAALAVLLILGGALGAGFLVLQSGKRVAAIEISQQVGAGQKIPLSAMQEIQVASDTGLNYVPWSQASQVAQFYAAGAIPPGTLLTTAMVVRASGVTTGKDVLGLALKDGQWPSQLAVGDHVTIYAVSGTAGAGCAATGGSPLSVNAIVLYASNGASGTTASGAATDVTVAVNPADAGAVACNASVQNVALVLLPAAGHQGQAGGASSAGSGGAGSPQNTASSSPSPSFGTG